MATTQIEEKPRIITPRNTRRNEIIAILLLAFGLLLALCLVSAAFYPNDPSWNSAGQTETHNLAGTIGANVAAALFQFVGLAAYLLPVLLFAAAWRRFRTRTMHAAFSSMIGLVMLVLAASALLSIAKLHPLFDESVPARNALKQSRELTGAERVAEFLAETKTNEATVIRGPAEMSGAVTATQPAAAAASAAAAAGAQRVIVQGPSAGRSIFSRSNS